ncbi:MAG: hypothetical protein IJY04_03385 [Clostridia bacterium]|nr:hypothetical protein [Clostridia bacterium]
MRDFKNIDKKYRPVPFWSWNDRLDTEETRRQVALMDEAGIGGYFMHARGGLQTEYMGEEWFDNVRAAISEGDTRGMHSWAYDENGWPSGFGGGKVSGLGEEYQQKSLHTEPLTEENRNAKTTVLERDGYRYYYEINEFYVDVLDGKVTDRFIEEIYAEYYRREGSGFDGFFTDEPQILRGTGYPWSFTLESEFRDAYGYSLIDSLDALFLPLENSKRVRLDYWQLVTRLFSENFFGRIYDWCAAHGYGLTGHLVCEESMHSQLVSNGAAMPHYEYFSIPGMDWLCRPVNECLTPVQVASVAAQMVKRQVLSETYAAAGHNVSHGELKRIFEWQMVHGINLLCPHLEGYSMRGIRKRDYPPAMYYQQPWWGDMPIFFDAMSRIGMLLSEGEVVADTLLIHPQTTAWILYDGEERGKDAVKQIDEYNRALLSDMRALEDKHILYHLGDETMISRHGRVENGRFIIGKMSYATLVLPHHIEFLPYTESLINEFRAQGGRVTSAESLEENTVCERNRLTYAKRTFDDFDLHYFVNTDNAEIEAEIAVGNYMLDPVSGDLKPFFGKHKFTEYESLALIDTHGTREKTQDKALPANLPLEGEWQVKDASFNSLTLDKCDYYFDGKLIERDGYVLNIIPRLCEYRRPVEVKQIYRFTCEQIPSEIFLGTETPDIFEIKLNGETVAKTDRGYFRDMSIRLISLAGLIQSGENLLELTSEIVQSEQTYRHLDNSWKFESMKNSLTYDMELEPIYIIGDFGVSLPGEIEELRYDAYKFYGQPIITASPRTVEISRLDRSGYPEFAGELVLEKRITADDSRRSVKLRGRGMNSVSLCVNGNAVATKMFPPYEVDISDHLSIGENTLELRILNNLRNMMGPHHLDIGESMVTSPRSFFKESNVFHHSAGADGSCHDTLDFWCDGYCLVHFGI